MQRFKRTLEHLLNPLHVYCRLRDMGMGGGPARVFCRTYERSVYRLIRP
jgi:hypothetical protein